MSETSDQTRSTPSAQSEQNETFARKPKPNHRPNYDGYFTSYDPELTNQPNNRRYSPYGNNSTSAKLILSNLDYSITNTDLSNMFSDFGALKTVVVDRDKYGKSLGTAIVVFQRDSDAIRAMKFHNGKNLDGRKLKIELISSRCIIRNRPEKQSAT